jgi:hypothetical protein
MSLMKNTTKPIFLPLSLAQFLGVNYKEIAIAFQQDLKSELA